MEGGGPWCVITSPAWHTLDLLHKLKAASENRRPGFSFLNRGPQVAVMQSSDVVVLGRGSRYAGNVAFLPKDRAVIEILPLGLDPTPAADVAQALDLRYVGGFGDRKKGAGEVCALRIYTICNSLGLMKTVAAFCVLLLPLLMAHSFPPVLSCLLFRRNRYHFVVTPPRALADVSRCNGRNGSFVQAYGLLASEWERRDGLGTSGLQWDHDSLKCIKVGPRLEGRERGGAVNERESKTAIALLFESWRRRPRCGYATLRGLLIDNRILLLCV